MQAVRSNEDWLAALRGHPAALQEEALVDLRGLLLRAALYTLVTHRGDLSGMEEGERLALAEDCAQDALQAVLARLDDFRGESKFTTWAYKFGINIALTRARQERWKNISLDALAEDEAGLDWLTWSLGENRADAEQPSLQAEAARVIEEVVRGELTAKQRQVLRWIAFDEVPMDVVCERLETNRNAVYKMLHDARLKIKRQLAARGYAVEEVYELFRAG